MHGQNHIKFVQLMFFIVYVYNVHKPALTF